MLVDFMFFAIVFPIKDFLQDFLFLQVQLLYFYLHVTYSEFYTKKCLGAQKYLHNNVTTFIQTDNNTPKFNFRTIKFPCLWRQQFFKVYLLSILTDGFSLNAMFQ